MARARARTHTHTHTQPVGDHEDVTVLWYQGVHTGSLLMANWPDTIIKNKKKKKKKKRKHAY